MGPVTTNPWLIAIINMTIVFGVLIGLGMLMSLIQVVDPTKLNKDLAEKRFQSSSCCFKQLHKKKLTFSDVLLASPSRPQVD